MIAPEVGANVRTYERTNAGDSLTRRLFEENRT